MDKDHRKHLTELRATLPASLEDVSDTAWLEFQALQASHEQQFQATQPLSRPAGLASGKGAAPRASAPPMSLDQALTIARRGNRACPMPEHWKAFYDVLTKLAPPGAVPPMTIDGAAWAVVPPMQKRMRLRDQLEWAERTGVLEPVVRFLQALPDEAWLHF
jgi:hypothetical protein